MFVGVTYFLWNGKRLSWKLDFPWNGMWFMFGCHNFKENSVFGPPLVCKIDENDLSKVVSHLPTKYLPPNHFSFNKFTGCTQLNKPRSFRSIYKVYISWTCPFPIKFNSCNHKYFTELFHEIHDFPFSPIETQTASWKIHTFKN